MPNKQEGLMFRVPATQAGEEFIANLKPYLNKDSYKLTKRYTGPRPHGTPQGSTLKENATSMRVYVKSKRDEDNINPYEYIERGREIERGQQNLQRQIEKRQGTLRVDEINSLDREVDQVNSLASQVRTLSRNLEEASWLLAMKWKTLLK